VLLYLPFAALTDGEKYLSDDYVLFTLPSASVLSFVQEKRKAGTGTILALGNPASPLPGLKFAEQEAQSIAGLYGAQALVGKDATESIVRARASEAGILHIAAHGEYDPQNPLFSTIHLAGDAENDGRLEVHEVYSLDLATSTDLVVLSACQTDVGAVSAGDEVVGLNRAFLFAGTPTVIASLWNVDDAATTLLMEKFYGHLRAGASKAQALRQAQLDVRATYPHPYYWAAFVLTGDPGTGVEAQSPWPFSGSRRVLWLAGIAGSLVCAFLAILVIYSAGKVIRNRSLRGREAKNDEQDPGRTDASTGDDAQQVQELAAEHYNHRRRDQDECSPAQYVVSSRVLEWAHQSWIIGQPQNEDQHHGHEDAVEHRHTYQQLDHGEFWHQREASSEEDHARE
jgi:hypothetical protein